MLISIMVFSGMPTFVYGLLEFSAVQAYSVVFPQWHATERIHHITVQPMDTTCYILQR